MKTLYFLIVAIIGVIVFLQCQKSEIGSVNAVEDPVVTKFNLSSQDSWKR